MACAGLRRAWQLRAGGEAVAELMGADPIDALLAFLYLSLIDPGTGDSTVTHSITAVAVIMFVRMIALNHTKGLIMSRSEFRLPVLMVLLLAVLVVTLPTSALSGAGAPTK
jgi:hypothetical protein